ncbi:MAG: type II toxin-antitoxin system VapC family toxin [Thermomicrobiales bacterium]
MSYLIDTDWLVDFLKGRPAAVRLLGRLAPDGLAISLVTFGEIYEGIRYGQDRAADEMALAAALEWIPIHGLDVEIMRRFAEIRGDLRNRRQLIGDFDTLIAATALHHDLTIVSRNRDHYKRVPSLRLLPEDD